MFHIELRQFPYVGRAFNLNRDELDARILGPWVTGAPIEVQERRWTSEKAKLTVLEGAQLRPDEIGMGRGWNNAMRSGEDVTTSLVEETRRQLQPSTGSALKEAIVEVAARVPVALAEVVELVAAQQPHRRPSELLGVAEQAIWELLHHGRVTMLLAGEEVDREQWQPLLLSWSSWTSGSDVTLQALQCPESRL
jgi:hypothetical protein